MLKRAIILLMLAAIVALPFLLRPEQRRAERADDVLTIITPHNEAIRHEFGLGFREWYREKTGRTVALDWRVIGGTSEIARFLESEYVAAFRNYWTGELGRSWSSEVQAGFANARLGANASAEARAAREAFLASDVSCGIDLFFGGGSYDFMLQAEAGRIVPMQHSEGREWLDEAVVPLEFAGERYRDPAGRWVGNVLSSYGIIYNRDALRRLGIEQPPERWRDLADPRLIGEVALADPTKSSSIAKAFENVIQQEMQRRARAGAGSAEDEAVAVREGWLAGLRWLQLIGANARYFTDSSQKPPIDVAQGNCAAGICIDFYGRAQAEVAAQRSGTGEGRLGFSTPLGGTVPSVDPIAILRGAPHREVAEAFVDFTFTLEGQKLWNFRPGTPGGPERYALRRLPVRRDFYENEEWKTFRSDPDEHPFEEDEQLVYRAERTGHLFREMSFIIRVMALDTHGELQRAWRAVAAAEGSAKEEALAVLQDLSAVTYERAEGEIKRALSSKNKAEELALGKRLGDLFRANYRRAEAMARGAE